MSDLILFMQRDLSREDEMLGDLYLAEAERYDLPWMHTLEDEKRMIKVPGETAVPAQLFELIKRPFGDSRLDARYREIYGDMYNGQIWLRPTNGDAEITLPDGSKITYAYMHHGNDESNTDGCILVGETKYVDTIGSSRNAYRKLYPVVSAAINDSKRKAFIDIRDAA